MKRTGTNRLRTFNISYENNRAVITTDKTRLGTLEALIMLIFQEYNRKKPQELEKLITKLNIIYNMIRSRRNIKEDSAPLDDTGLWETAPQSVEGGD